jgi:hypothetical protein
MVRYCRTARETFILVPLACTCGLVNFVIGPLAETLLKLGTRKVAMSKVENIGQEIKGLTPSELAVFRRWFLEFDAQVWDNQIEEDVRKGKLNNLAEEALAAHRAGKSKEL